MLRKLNNAEKYKDNIQGWLILYKINKTFEDTNEKESLLELVPPQYNKFLSFFEKADTNRLLFNWLMINRSY